MAVVILGACAAEPFVADPEIEGAACTIEGTERFLPLATGNQWTVQREKLETGITEDKVQVVGELADLGGDKAGIMAYRVTTTKATGEGVAWQEDTGTSVRRHLDEDRAGMNQGDDVFIDHKTRLDESPDLMTEGTMWSETFTIESTDLMTMETIATDKEYLWEVVRYGEMVTVPSGSFCTMQITRTNVNVVDGVAGKSKQYWYARGVGKVKERSRTSREVLIDYTIP